MRVLVVDDDIKQLELLRDAFEHVGVDVFLAHSADEAERIFREAGTPISCIITDVDLGSDRKTGIWFIENVAVDLPALIVTGRGPDDPEVSRCVASRSAATHCLGKPYSIIDLFQWYETATSQPLRQVEGILAAS